VKGITRSQGSSMLHDSKQQQQQQRLAVGPGNTHVRRCGAARAAPLLPLQAALMLLLQLML